MLDEVDYFGMIELMADQMHISPLPLIVGKATRPDEYGALRLAWMAFAQIAVRAEHKAVQDR
ncbi:MAG: hypothetical protein AAFQ12_13360 [Pseudomonadota bacterium]